MKLNDDKYVVDVCVRFPTYLDNLWEDLLIWTFLESEVIYGHSPHVFKGILEKSKI